MSVPKINKVTMLKHLTVVANHLSDIDRIVPAVFGADVIDIAAELPAVRRLPQPGTTSEILIGCGVNPELLILDVARYVRSVCLPPIDLFS